MGILVYILGLLLSVVLQVLLFNHLSLFGGVAFIYVVALLKCPVEIRHVVQIIMGFLVGFVIDIFCNTPGMHSLTAVSVMALRDIILHLYNNDPEFKSGTVNKDQIGTSTYARFSLSIITLHSILLYIIESFTLFNFPVLLTKIFISVALTFGLCMAFEYATSKK
jgi:hypothetical protein